MKQALLANGDSEEQTISKEQFKRVNFWFDFNEGRPDTALKQEWEIERRKKLEEDDYATEEEEDDGRVTRLDEDRLT